MMHNPRDDNGWRVPRPGTKSAQIYAMLREGASNTEIAAALRCSLGSVGVLKNRMRHPEHSNRVALALYHGRDRHEY